MTPERDAAGRPASDAGAHADLEAQLEAERAGTAYWREVAAARRADAARVQRRPLVRAAVAIDRRTHAAQAAAEARARRLTDRSQRLGVAAAGLRRRRDLPARRRHLADQLAAVVPAPRVAGPAVVVHLGAAPAHQPGPGATLVGLPATASTQAIDQAVATQPGATVCLLGPTTATLADGWLAHLAAPLGGGVAATTPLVVHPERPWPTATTDDLLVRWAGLDVTVDAEGAPVLMARDAGTPPHLLAPRQPVASASSTAVVVDRAAWDESDGLAPGLPYDAAIVDLCTRLRHAGGTIELVPAAAVVDSRPVASRSDLRGPLLATDAGWRAVVERHGPALVAASAPRPAGSAPTIALTTATPSRKIAAHSGDWHYAGCFAAALRRAGHPVRVQTIEEADSLPGRACDVHLVLRGLEPVAATPGQRHVLWIISHPEAIDPAECDAADLVLVASERFAAHLRGLTDTPVEVLLQATDPDHFHPGAADAAHRHDVAVVANTRGVSRPAVADAIAAGLHPSVYGQGWSDLAGASLVADYVDFASLPAVYASAGVVLNDHWETMRRWGFVSNRIFDVLACGTPVVSDALPEVADLFGDLVPTWSSADELGEVVAALRADPDGTAERTAAARALVLARHTFDHRTAELAELLRRHGLIEEGGRS